MFERTYALIRRSKATQRFASATCHLCTTQHQPTSLNLRYLRHVHPCPIHRYEIYKKHGNILHSCTKIFPRACMHIHRQHTKNHSFSSLSLTHTPNIPPSRGPPSVQTQSLQLLSATPPSTFLGQLFERDGTHRRAWKSFLRTHSRRLYGWRAYVQQFFRLQTLCASRHQCQCYYYRCYKQLQYHRITTANAVCHYRDCSQASSRAKNMKSTSEIESTNASNGSYATHGVLVAIFSSIFCLKPVEYDRLVIFFRYMHTYIHIMYMHACIFKFENTRLHLTICIRHYISLFPQASHARAHCLRGHHISGTAETTARASGRSIVRVRL